MFRRAAAISLTCLAMIHPAQAVDFSKVRCESPQMVDLLRQKLRTVQVDGGSALSSYGAFIEEVANVGTVVAAAKKLVCRATVGVTYQGSSRRMRTHVAFQQRQDGKINSTVSFD